MRIVLGIRLAQYQKKRAIKLDCNIDYIYHRSCHSNTLIKFLCNDITNGLYSLFLQHATALVVKFDKKTPVQSSPKLFPRSHSPDDIVVISPTRHTVGCEIEIITVSPRGTKPVSSKTTTTTTTTTATAAASTTKMTNKEIVVSIWEKIYGSYSGCHLNRFHTFFEQCPINETI